MRIPFALEIGDERRAWRGGDPLRDGSLVEAGRFQRGRGRSDIKTHGAGRCNPYSPDGALSFGVIYAIPI